MTSLLMPIMVRPALEVREVFSLSFVLGALQAALRYRVFLYREIV